MPRSRERVNLSDGLRLDLNKLLREGSARPGCRTVRSVTWTHSYWGEIANAILTIEMSSNVEGHLIVELGGSSQTVMMVTEPRHFGGGQWYFVCPYTNRRCSVLYRPPGARRFGSRQTWGKQVAYGSQFLDRDNLAHRGKAKINARLCQIGDFDPDEWDFPPKPKWMRWAVYKRAEIRFDAYDSKLDEGMVELLAKFARRGLLK
jgi:hypothetical protein